MVEAALPVWAEAGIDARGRAVEALDFEGRPVVGLPLRCRVQARQLYVLCEARRRGWRRGGALAQRAFQTLIDDHRRDDGLWRRTVDDDGRIVDDAPDLYDQAFALYALSAAHRELGEARARDLALETLQAMSGAMAHPAGGWVEAIPPVTPRRQNPHMHMLEAMLAWKALAPDVVFTRTADRCLDLMRTRFRVDGTVREYFTDDLILDPQRGAVVEPGHQMEWAWLLLEAGAPRVEATELATAAMACGLGSQGLLVREVTPSAEPIDGGERLWAQTEAVRALDRLGDAEEADRLLTRMLDTHLATATPGLWIDSFDAEGRALDARVPASTLYHLMTMTTAILPEGKA